MRSKQTNHIILYTLLQILTQLPHSQNSFYMNAVTNVKVTWHTNGLYFEILIHNLCLSPSYKVTYRFMLPSSCNNTRSANPHLIQTGLSAVFMYVYRDTGTYVLVHSHLTCNGATWFQSQNMQMPIHSLASRDRRPSAGVWHRKQCMCHRTQKHST